MLDDQAAFNYVYAVGDRLDSRVTVSSVKTPEPSAVTGKFAAAVMLAGWLRLSAIAHRRRRG
ncbi:MAG: hypothetical protein MJA27_21075 [Pseudanabaenales cyanobacterium]|nr:hypothetical protein [Pseudanabaenales cyanobacterium]